MVFTVSSYIVKSSVISFCFLLNKEGHAFGKNLGLVKDHTIWIWKTSSLKCEKTCSISVSNKANPLLLISKVCICIFILALRARYSLTYLKTWQGKDHYYSCKNNILL